MHIAGGDEKDDDGENVHMVLKDNGKGRDKRGDLWDKFEVVAKFSSKDYKKPWLAKDAALKKFRHIKKWGER